VFPQLLLVGIGDAYPRPFSLAGQTQDGAIERDSATTCSDGACRAGCGS
jgi:hypothetical protein